MGGSGAAVPTHSNIVGNGLPPEEGDGAMVTRDAKGKGRMVTGKWEKVVGHAPFAWRFTAAKPPPGSVRVVWVSRSCVDRIPEVFGRLMGPGRVVPEEREDGMEEGAREVNEEDYDGDVDSEG